MIAKLLPNITDAASYMTALSLINTEGPLTKEQMDRLLALCAKYLPTEEDTDYYRVSLAIDLLPRQDGPEAIALLGLDAQSTAALVQARDLINSRDGVTVEQADRIAAAVTGSAVRLPAQIVLGRIALDCMISSVNFAQLRGQITALTDYLRGLGTQTLDKYTPLAMELKCRCKEDSHE